MEAHVSPDRFAGFRDVVTSLEGVHEVVGETPPKVVAKVIDHIDDLCREFIAMSPFCVIATSGADGHFDLSPKGDPAGFVRVLDDKHIAIPDRPGNRRVDTFRNLIENPRIGIIFLIPGKGETLRIGGEARVVRDEELLASMAVKERPPKLAIVVHVERVFMHCPKCMIRSKLWKPDYWPDSSGVADIGQAMIKHGGLDQTEEELLEEVTQQGLTRIY